MSGSDHPMHAGRCGIVVRGKDEPDLDRPKGCTCSVYRAVNEDELLAARCSKGDRVWFRHTLGKGPFRAKDAALSPWKQGTVVGSMFYDGVSIRVYEADPDDLITHTLFPEFGDRLSLTGPEADASSEATA